MREYLNSRETFKKRENLIGKMPLAHSVLVLVVWFLVMYVNVMFILILYNKKSELHSSPLGQGALPQVSIVVPAFNEERSIEESIHSLKAIDYPKEKLEIIIVNDGSTDNTAHIVRTHTTESYFRFIDHANNKGKAACLNEGIGLAAGEFVACMDADSQVAPDIIRKTVPFFDDAKVGAVTVRVEAKNPKTLLEKVVEIEYTIGLSLGLRVLSFFNALFVTPGPFSVYRKSMLLQIGLFDTESITEDYEIAYRIQKARYKIAACINTSVATEVPQNFKELYAQRRRWYSGALMTVVKHRNALFNAKYGSFGIAIPYLFSVILLGLGVFVFSLYLLFTNIARMFTNFALTDYNVISYVAIDTVDILSVNALTILAITTIIATIGMVVVNLKFAKKKIGTRLQGFVGFLFFFLFYQLFWAVSIYSVMFGKKVKWR